MNLKFNTYLKFLKTIIICFLISSPTKADSTFQVSNIDIQIETQSSINVRNIAIQSAENKGLDLLAKKILTTNDYLKFRRLNSVDASFLVESLEFLDEVILKNKYKVTFNIRYNPIRVREFLKAHNLTYTETKSKKIPLYAILANHEEFYNVDKSWRNKWSEKIGTHYALNIDYINLSREQKNLLTLPSFLNLDFITSDQIYDSNNLILIWCEPKIKGSKIEFNIISKIIINNKTKIISNNFLKDFSINDSEYIDEIIIALENNIYNHWVDTTSRSSDVQNHKFQFNFNDFNEWLAVRNILRNLDSIASFQISEISNKKIEGDIEFFGDVSKLRLILNENNVHVSDLGSFQIIQLKND